MRRAFSKVDVEALYLEGVHIVLVASITKEQETVEKIMPWVEMLQGRASCLFVRNWVTEREDPREAPTLDEESFTIEQRHYNPPELLRFIQNRQMTLHSGVYPYLPSFRRPYVEAKRRGSTTALNEWNTLRNAWWQGFDPAIRNGSNFMPSAMALDRFTRSWIRLLKICCRQLFRGARPGCFL